MTGGASIDRLVVSGLGVRDLHDTGPSHPERPARLDAVLAGVRDALGDDAVGTEARVATAEELTRVHSEAHLRTLERLCETGGGSLDPDTVVSSGSCSTARLAAGAGLGAIAALDDGRGDAAFVAVRPPGHHARPDRGMGFCLLNNIAVAAAALVARGERVLVVDWDVHHGNGTQEAFWDEPDVLYASLHEHPLYPGTGAVTETGGAAAPGATLNVPLPAGATGDVFLRTFDEVIGAAADDFAPTWVLVSAGFDAHRDDPLADLALSSGDYALLARRVAGLASRPGRLVLFLEGGYDLEALRNSVAATLGGLGDREVTTEAPTSGGPGDDAVRAALDVRRRLDWDG